MITYRQVRQHHLDQAKKASPSRGPQILVIGFALIILVGALLLTLPVATQNGQGLAWNEALFTATSAATVTGLVVVTTISTFSMFGQIVILVLIQVGGVGFITLSVVLFRLIGRRVTLYERNLLSQTLGVGSGQGIVSLTLTVLLIVVAIELAGAIILFSQWVQLMAWPQAAYFALFHSVSAFCNAGFDLFTGFDDPLLQSTRTNPLSLICLGLLITIGSLGITAIYDLLMWPRERHLSLHTRLILPMTLFLFLFGAGLVVIDETLLHGQALAFLPLGQKVLLSAFTVVASRTAGMTFFPLADLSQASQLILLIWMFIGGAPASMGGGAGISTVAVVLVTLASIVRGHNEVRIFGRTLPTETVYKAVAIITVSTALVIGMTLLLTFFGAKDLFAVAFEVVSAFSNTGYSLGLTPQFGLWGQLALAFTMFWGRLGPLTLMVALAQRSRQSLINYPEEKIILG